VSQVAIANDLFTLSDPPVLIGGRCTRCSAYTFPVRDGCPRCGSDSVERHELGSRGTLYSWTSQGFPPKLPFRGEALLKDPFEPWFVGLVEVEGKLRVEGWLVGVQQDEIEFGMPVRVVLATVRTDDSGDEVVTYAFAPDGPADAERNSSRG
jgi:uncharacterized OB-fold protein